MTARIRAAVTAAALLSILLFAGCAAPQTGALRMQAPAGLATQAELAAVPFFPQKEFQCGPAALATVLAYSGVAASPETLMPQVYLPGREGSLQTEMLAATRRHHRVAYQVAPRLENVLIEVAAGNPVIVLQNLAFNLAPLWHYAVVVGYDREREEIVLRSGVTRRLTMTFSTFERTWARGGHWSMVALPPRRLPETAIEGDYVAAVAALERISATDAQPAYAAALERWPANPVARIGIGNAAYVQGDLAAAEAAYRRATIDHPRNGDGWNNLAQVQFELGRRNEALIAARRAVALGGARAAHYRETLETITASP
ncbi:MAG: PA2778 family cysteine peptidase [Burkholderiales bacterium]